MSITLEVKKFLNSEYIGSYADVEIPADYAQPVQRQKKGVKLPFSRRDDELDELEAEIAREEQAERQRAAGAGPASPQPSSETVHIHYIEQGSGEPLILVHSIGQSLYTWRNVFSRLSLNYRVIAIDLPGHGYSSRPQAFAYTIEEQANILRLFMDALGIQSAHFISFSMASMYVLRLALDTPERVGRLMLIAPGGMSADMPLAIKMLDSSLFGTVASMLYGMRTVDNVLADCLFDLTLTMSPEVVAEYYKTICDRPSRAALRASFHNFDDASVMNGLRALDAPVLMLQGSEDRWRGQENAEVLHSAMPFAGFTAIRNAGHLVHEEKAERVIAATLEFIPVMQPNAGQ